MRISEIFYLLSSNNYYPLKDVIKKIPCINEAYLYYIKDLQGARQSTIHVYNNAIARFAEVAGNIPVNRAIERINTTRPDKLPGYTLTQIRKTTLTEMVIKNITF
jgi:hypothetical protein